MLKDITLGQYFPSNSIVHRLDPRIKLILTFVYIFALFAAKFVFSYAVMLLWLILAMGLSRIRPGTIFRGIKPLIIIIILTGILNLFYTPGEPIVQFWILKITHEGIRNAIFMITRIIMLIAGTFLLTYTTSPIMLTNGLESLLNPLKRFNVPVHELSMMMSIALRFIPTIIEETDKIMSAQKARGADFESGGLLKRVRAFIPILVPLFVSAIRRSEELATAMECRCYNGGEGRTRLRQLKMAKRDAAALIVSGAAFAATWVLGAMGL